jgi:hypothetical protein
MAYARDVLYANFATAKTETQVPQDKWVFICQHMVKQVKLF